MLVARLDHAHDAIFYVSTWRLRQLMSRAVKSAMEKKNDGGCWHQFVVCVPELVAVGMSTIFWGDSGLEARVPDSESGTSSNERPGKKLRL